MNKYNIVLFGISDAIWGVVKERLNFFNVEISAFIDNDINKQGISIDGIPILGSNNFDYSKVDYVIVAALSAYVVIKENLEKQGVIADKIMPFITEQLCEYCLGELDEYDLNVINKLYNVPTKIVKLLERYKKIYSEYNKIIPYELSDKEWFFKGNLISHACGGKIGDFEYMYTNSKEGLEYSISNGFKLIECDIMKMNNELVVAHDFTKIYESRFDRFSMHSFRDILYALKKHPEITLLVDVKWENEQEYFDILQLINKDIKFCDTYKDSKEFLQLKSQVVMEAYNEETISLAKQNGFEVFFTQYRNPNWQEFMNTVNICYKYGVKVVGLGSELALVTAKRLNIFTNKNINIFSFSTDSIDEISMLRKIGVKGAFTNYFVENKPLNQ